MPFSRRSLLATLFSLPVVALALPARAATHKVVIKSFKFSPAKLSISAGDTVVFENQDDAPHTGTGKGFDTGRLNRGESGQVTISERGTYNYVCKFHPRMKGQIVVS